MRARVVVIVQPDDRTTLPALAGVTDASFLVHLRFAPSAHEDAWREALAARARMPGVPFVVSAREPQGLDGVHLGGALRSELDRVRAELARGEWVSVPAHTDDDVAQASQAGASAAYVSPIFASPGKGPARGLGALARARELAGAMRIYALGGVDATNAGACVTAGADGVAVIRAIAAATSPADALLAIDREVRRGLASRGAS